MKNKLTLLLFTATICTGSIFLCQHSSISAQQNLPSNFGNLKQQIRILADQDTDRFLEALENAIRIHFQGNSQGRNQFLKTFQAQLGLERYAKNQKGIKEFERLRKFMEEDFVNGAAEFDKLRTILKIYTIQAP